MLNFNHNSQNEIPVFFSTDDNYIPYLDVAIASLIANASKEYEYRIVVLNTGILPENIEKVKKNERPGFSIDFIDISVPLENIKIPTLALRYNTSMLQAVLKKLKKKVNVTAE